jgi:ketosteroid isomerase-like protein
MDNNIDLARRAFEAASTRPRPEFETVNALFHPDHEFLPSTYRVDGRSFRGADGFRDWLRDTGETVSFEGVVEEATELDRDRVLLAIVTYGQGKSSGAQYRVRRGYVMTLRDGKVVRTESYPSPEEAFKVAR